MGKASREKGKRGERKLANELKQAFPELADGIKRGLQSRGGGAEVADVVGVPGFHFEHKSGKAPNPRAALKQAIADAQPGAMPIAVVRDDRCPPFAVLRWEDLLCVLKRGFPSPALVPMQVNFEEEA